MLTGCWLVLAIRCCDCDCAVTVLWLCCGCAPCRCLPGAGWCLQSDVVPDSPSPVVRARRQILPGYPALLCDRTLDLGLNFDRHSWYSPMHPPPPLHAWYSPYMLGTPPCDRTLDLGLNFDHFSRKFRPHAHTQRTMLFIVPMCGVC